MLFSWLLSIFINHFSCVGKKNFFQSTHVIGELKFLFSFAYVLVIQLFLFKMFLISIVFCLWTDMNWFCCLWTDLNWFCCLWTDLNWFCCLWTDLNWFCCLWTDLNWFCCFWTNLNNFCSQMKIDKKTSRTFITINEGTQWIENWYNLVTQAWSWHRLENLKHLFVKKIKQRYLMINIDEILSR